MKKLLMTSAAAATMGPLVAAGADAADLYTPPPADPMPAPVWSWTGPYAGLHVGAIDGDIDSSGADPFFSSKGIDGEILDPNGIMGGIQAGYNYQFDSIVLGIEGDFSLGDVDDVIYPPFLGRWEAQIDWMATIRARLGWAWDRTLFYATGGVAFTGLEIKAESNNFDETEKYSMVGWTVGGGVEHAVTDYLSLKAEYLYADFGKKDAGLDLAFQGDEGNIDLTTHTFRVGVNWLF